MYKINFFKSDFLFEKKKWKTIRLKCFLYDEKWENLFLFSFSLIGQYKHFYSAQNGQKKTQNIYVYTLHSYIYAYIYIDMCTQNTHRKNWQCVRATQTSRRSVMDWLQQPRYTLRLVSVLVFFFFFWCL